MRQATQSSAATLIEVLQAQSVRRPDFPIYTFLIDGENETAQLTYQQLEEQASAIAAELAHHAQPGERVLLLLPQGLEYIAALFGCFYAGLVAVPAYPPRNNHNIERLKLIIADCGAKIALADSSVLQAIAKIKGISLEVPLLNVEGLPPAPPAWQGPPVELEDLAYLQYTSGSTSAPKGVMISFRNLADNIALIVAASHMDPGQKMVTWAPVFHDMGLVFGLLAPFVAGIPCVFMAPYHFVQKPARWLQAISQHGATITFAPNFAYNLCTEKIQDEDCAALDLSKLEIAVIGAEPVRLATLLHFHQKFKPFGFEFGAFYPCYGLAEATLFVSQTPKDQPLGHLVPGRQEKSSLREADGLPADAPAAFLVSNGVAAGTNMKLRIVNPQRRQPCAEGEEGELWIEHNDSIASGYWQREEETTQTFHATLAGQHEPHYMRTGDLAMLCQGELYITGRLKDLIIIRGKNFYPQDIEFVAQQAHPALAFHGGAAFSIEEGGTEKMVLAQEVKREYWKQLDPETIFEAVRRAVAEDFEIGLHAIVLLLPMSLPKTSSGKIQRQLTRQQYLDSSLKELARWEDPQAAAASGEAQEALLGPDAASIQAWLLRQIAEKARLPLAEVKPEDEVRHYPLESVEAMLMAEDLSKQLGIRVSADAFWALPSIAALAEFLAEKCASAKNG
jgi:acyl-CoA synthetase (AMP-forming)/AMP-acid ligase II/acyl carrier protein